MLFPSEKSSVAIAKLACVKHQSTEVIMLISEKNSIDGIKRHITKLRDRQGFCDLLSYLMQWDENTILHKDFSLSKHFCYQPPDLSAANDQQCDYYASVWKHALHFLGNGWMVETQIISQPYQPPPKTIHYPEIVSSILNDERRQQYANTEYYNTLYRLSITWKPPSHMLQKLERFTFSMKNETKPKHFSLVFDEFKKRCTEFINYLKKAVCSIVPLENAQLTSFLANCISGEVALLNKADVGHFLDCYLSTYDFIAGFEPKIGNKEIAVLTLDELPTHSYPCLLETLNHLPLAYRWSSRFITLDRSTAHNYLKRYEKSWSSKAIGLAGVVRESLGLPSQLDQYAQGNVENLIHAQTDNMAGDIAHGFYNSVIVLMHENKALLNEKSQEVTSVIQQLNFKVRRERVNACEAYLGSFPGHGDYNLRKMLVDTNYVSHAFLISGFYQGEWQAPSNMPGYEKKSPLLVATMYHSRPFALNIHVSDVGHCAILGPTGSGKSTLIAMLMLGHRQYQGSRIIMFDKDYSNQTVIQALEGQYYDLTEQTCQFSPLARVKANDNASIDEAVSWLTECCYLQNVEVTPTKKQLLQQAVQRLAYEEDCYKNLNHLSIQEPTIRAALAAFNSGMVQFLLNGTKINTINNDVVGFNMGDLISNNTQSNASAIAILKAIFNELMIQFSDQRPTLLILEEAWLYLKHPLFLNQLTDWFKTLRKANVAVIFISQDLHDIVESSAASTIQTACMTRIYCPNKAACESHIAAQYKNFGLNELQIEQIAKAMPKRDYYYQSALGYAMFQLDLGVVAQSLLCMNNKTEKKRFEEIHKHGDPQWILQWLHSQKLYDWENKVKQNYFGG
jgi:type IV secretion system protein TrbE